MSRRVVICASARLAPSPDPVSGTAIRLLSPGGAGALGAPLGDEAEAELAREDDRLDRVSRMGAACARRLAREAGWSAASSPERIGVNIGSSRGATGLFERHHAELLGGGRLSPLTSPLTTTGNLASFAADAIHETLGLERCSAVFGHSSTCTSGLHAILNGVAWLTAGLCDAFVCGGAEAPLTPFTIAQMRALRIYAEDSALPHPCRPLAAARAPGTGMVLGEGACLFALATEGSDNGGGPLARILGIGAGFERAPSPSGLSADGSALERSMLEALRMAGGAARPDAVVLHAPGTRQGDEAELGAIRRVFGEELPLLVSNKWRIGHSLGASGAFNVATALELIAGKMPPETPYRMRHRSDRRGERMRTVLVNACGFGGNAASVILSE